MTRGDADVGVSTLWKLDKRSASLMALGLESTSVRDAGSDDGYVCRCGGRLDWTNLSMVIFDSV